LRYIVSPIALIDLLALLPFYLSAGFQDAYLLRLARLSRVLSLARFGRYSIALRNIFVAIRRRRYELVMSLIAAFVVMFFSASALHFTEAAQNPENFGSIPRALWWGVATVTKVGYGGAFPVTPVGKIFSAVFSIAAVAVVALPTGILAAAFGDAFRREKASDDVK
jgi:voltage-gated potassium channel